MFWENCALFLCVISLNRTFYKLSGKISLLISLFVLRLATPFYTPFLYNHDNITGSMIPQKWKKGRGKTCSYTCSAKDVPANNGVPLFLLFVWHEIYFLPPVSEKRYTTLLVIKFIELGFDKAWKGSSLRWKFVCTGVGVQQLSGRTLPTFL